MERICPVCNDDMIRNGGRTLRIVDIDPPSLGQRSVRLQRFRCANCRLTDEEDGPRLRRGYRMTEDAFDWVGRAACLRSFAEVASKVEVDRRTARSVWNEWVLERMEGMGTPAICQLRRPFPREGTIVAVGIDGDVLSVFESENDMRLGPWLEGIGLVFLTPDVAMSIRHEFEAGRMAVRRGDVREWVESRIPDVQRRAAAWLDRDDLRLLRAAREAMLVRRELRTDEHEASIESLPFRSLVRDLVSTIDGLRRVWMAADPERARGLYDSWHTSRSTFARDACAPIVTGISQIETSLFDGPYSELDDDFRRTELRVPPTERGELPSRRVGRVFALNHSATWRSISDLARCTAHIWDGQTIDRLLERGL